MTATTPHGRFVSMADAEKEVALSASTINRLHRRGEFPPKRRLSPGRVGWFESELQDWKAKRPIAPSAGRPAAPPS